VLSHKVAQRPKLWALAGVLVAAAVAALAGWRYGRQVKELSYRLTDVSALTAAAERALKPGDPIKECTGCPVMVVVPEGKFMMGSAKNDAGHWDDEEPRHEVAIARSFAVSRYEVTFDEWDACVAHGDCPRGVSASDWGRGRQPVINVSWDNAKRYVTWLSRITGKPYRLLSEAEWEYAARAGSDKAYSWGDEIKLDGKAMANCDRCGSEWDGKQTSPVGSFAPNAFGLYDMHGNVWEWVEDCYQGHYNGAPTDGAASTAGNCDIRIIRGGAWDGNPGDLRSAGRNRFTTDDQFNSLGFRVGRTLAP